MLQHNKNQLRVFLALFRQLQDLELENFSQLQDRIQQLENLSTEELQNLGLENMLQELQQLSQQLQDLELEFLLHPPCSVTNSQDREVGHDDLGDDEDEELMMKRAIAMSLEDS